MTTPHILFELLENSGFIKNNAVDHNKVRRTSLTEIIDLGAMSAEITSAEQLPRDTRAFAHSASLSLGGGIHPCSRLPCRIRHAIELSQFAALYSDKVYIHNFLTNLASHPDEPHDLSVLRAHLANGLEVLLRLRPLITAKRVIPVTSAESGCAHCFMAKVNAINDFDPHVKQGLTSARDYLRKRFLTEAKVTIRMEGRQYEADIRAPEDLVEHGHHTMALSRIPLALQTLPEVRQRLMRGQAVTLTQKQLAKLRHHEDEVAAILQNVFFEFTISQSFGTSFLTERPIHLKLLQSLTPSSQQEKRNALLKKHLTTLVPFLEGAEPTDLLKLREQEADSFIVFRQAINRAIDEASDKTSEFTERHARELYGDVLEPSLAKLDLKLRSAQNSLVKTSRRKATAWVGAITFGLFSGLLPSSLAAAAKVLGLTKVLADLGEAALQTKGDENLIRSEDMYFLWKVRQTTRSR